MTLLLMWPSFQRHTFPLLYVANGLHVHLLLIQPCSWTSYDSHNYVITLPAVNIELYPMHILIMIVHVFQAAWLQLWDWAGPPGPIKGTCKEHAAQQDELLAFVVIVLCVPRQWWRRYGFCSWFCRLRNTFTANYGQWYHLVYDTDVMKNADIC